MSGWYWWRKSRQGTKVVQWKYGHAARSFRVHRYAQAVPDELVVVSSGMEEVGQDRNRRPDSRVEFKLKVFGHIPGGLYSILLYPDHTVNSIVQTRVIDQIFLC